MTIISTCYSTCRNRLHEENELIAMKMIAVNLAIDCLDFILNCSRVIDYKIKFQECLFINMAVFYSVVVCFFLSKSMTNLL